MKPKTLVLMLVAIGCGLVAAFLVTQLKSRGTGNTEKVVAANFDMKPGQKITNVETEFAEKEMPMGLVPGAVPSEKIKGSPPALELAGKVLAKPLAKGEIITESHLKDTSITEGLGEGFQATSIPVRIDTAVAGFILPHSRVNLICTYTKPGGQGKVTTTFLKGAEVLAVNSDPNRPQDVPAYANPTSLTLAVTKLEAQRIGWAKGSGGEITLALLKTVDIDPKKVDDDRLKESKEKGDGETDSLPGQDKNGTTPAIPKEDSVLVAKAEIKAGTKVSKPSEFFEVVKVPQAEFNSRYVPSITDQIFSDADRSPRVVQVALNKGDPVRFVDLGESAPVGSKREPEGYIMTIMNGGKEPIRTRFERVETGPWSGGTGAAPGITTVPPATLKGSEGQ